MAHSARTPARRLRFPLAPALLGLIALSTAAAVEPPVRHFASQTEERPPALLVMTNGKVVEGAITPCSGGYMVEKANGRMLVPSEQVQFDALNHRDAYRKLRLSMPSRTAQGHVALARWCITYNLFDQAEGELRDALELEPKREEAREMLVRLDDLRRPKPEPSDDFGSASRRSDGFEVPEARALSGLSREAAGEFVSRIQPLLLNTCGNASCHSSSSPQEFRLLHVRNGRNTHRIFAVRNLAQVLKQIDVRDPDRSPLLAIPDDTHGRAGRQVFAGQAGNEQRETLRAWVRAVAREPAVAAAAAVSSRNGTAESPAPSAESLSPSPGPVTEIIVPVTGRAPAAPLKKPDDLVERVLREERDDAFDPDAFNRATRDPTP